MSLIQTIFAAAGIVCIGSVIGAAALICFDVLIDDLFGSSMEDEGD